MRCSSVRSGQCWALEHEVTESQGHPSWAMSVIHRCFSWLPIVQYVRFQNGSTSHWEAADGWFFLKNKGLKGDTASNYKYCVFQELGRAPAESQLSWNTSLGKERFLRSCPLKKFVPHKWIRSSRHRERPRQLKLDGPQYVCFCMTRHTGSWNAR